MSGVAETVNALRAQLAEANATIEELRAEDGRWRRNAHYLTQQVSALIRTLAARIPAPPDGPGPWVWDGEAWVGTLETPFWAAVMGYRLEDVRVLVPIPVTPTDEPPKAGA